MEPLASSGSTASHKHSKKQSLRIQFRKRKSTKEEDIPQEEQTDGNTTKRLASFDLKKASEKIAEKSMEKFDHLIGIYEKSQNARDSMISLLQKSNEITHKLNLKYAADIKGLHKSDEIRTTCLQNMTEQCKVTMDCSICFEPIACAHNVVPCGHVFCYICIQYWFKVGTNLNCPQCQTPYNQRLPFIPNKTQDAIVWQFQQNFGAKKTSFNEYEKRLARGNDAKKRDENGDGLEDEEDNSDIESLHSSSTNTNY